MTVSELIKILQKVETPDSAEIMIKDTAAGYRDIDSVKSILGRSDSFVICTKKTKRKRHHRDIDE